MYGKIIDGNFIIAPNPLESQGAVIYNPTPKQYKSEGYLEVIEMAYPTDGKYYKKSYIERDGVIYRDWIEAEAPERELTIEDRIRLTEEQLTDTQLALCELYEMMIV